mgnify:FL=1
MMKKVLLGIISGLICGLFASGGGLILVPAYVYILHMDDVKARASSVFSILPMVTVSGLVYYKERLVDFKLGILCAIGGIVGGIIGAKLLKKMPTKYLKIFYAIFLMYASIKMIFLK